MKNKSSLKKTFSILLLNFIAITLLGPMYTNCDQSGMKLTQKTPASVAGTGSTSNPVSNGNGATALPFSSTTNPLLKYAWHLVNTGQTVFATTTGIAGNDLQLQNTWNSGIFGQNIKIQLSDDGIEDTHQDLNANYLYDNTSKDYTTSAPYLRSSAPPNATDDDHGTNVAGIIAAVNGNNYGASGVAPKAKLISTNFLSGNVTQTEALYLDQATGNFDISNMSWGSSQNTIFAPDTSYEAVLKNQVLTKRNGKGSIYVKAAGNDFAVDCNGSTTTTCIGNSNFDPDNTNPYIVVTAATNALGNSSSYSSVGSNLWISGFGGEFGTDSAAMFSTDRSGCANGYAKSSSTSTIAFQKGGSENSSCNYNVTFNGTSAAAPTITGSIALLLEANPNLSWRDVKYVLAKTATPLHYNTTISIPHPLGTAVPAGSVWELPWVQNQAGFKFHNWYGFGRVNVDAAVALAKNYNVNLGTYSETNWASTSGALNLSVADNSATGASHALNVTQNLKVEAVQVKVWVTHPDISELALELTAPSGTKSILVNMRNSLTGITDYSGEVFLSNAFYQESTTGNWTIKVIDGKAGNTGTLTQWQLNFAGGSP
jgi:subtilisin-like proprotein convertase family protein